MEFLRRLRSMVTIGAGWGVLWGIAGGVTSSVILALLQRGSPGGGGIGGFVNALLGNAALFAFWGFMSGLVFTTTIAVAEKGRPLSTLSSRRLALWGGLGAVYLPLLIVIGTALTSGASFRLAAGPVVVTLALGAALGALSAAGTLAVARKAGAGADEASTAG